MHHATTKLSIAALQHMLMQTACHVFCSVPQTWSPKCENVECYFLEPEIVTTLTSEMIQKETREDSVLPQVFGFIISGWPTMVVDPSFASFKSKRDELTT